MEDCTSVKVWSLVSVYVIIRSYMFIHFQVWFSASPELLTESFGRCACLVSRLAAFLSPYFGDVEGMVSSAHRDTFDSGQSGSPVRPSSPLQSPSFPLAPFGLFHMQLKNVHLLMYRVMPGIWQQVVMLLVSKPWQKN